MDWSELLVKVPVEDTETASAIAQMVVPYGIYIEDYSDLLTEVPRIAHIDLIDEELLEKDRTHAVIHLYLKPDENPAEAISFLTGRLTAENIPHTVSHGSVREEDWSTAWKKYYHPVKIGEKLVVCPSWESYEPKAGEVVICLDPGMAFGTGTHLTTQLCLAELEKYVTHGTRLLDMGCGSGILSIGALLLGAESAIGVDIDSVAVRVAEENAQMNRIGSDRFTPIFGDILTDQKLQNQFEDKGYDVISANIVADVIIPMAPLFFRYLKDNGTLITSGIIAQRQEEVAQALVAAGFAVTATSERDGWVAITAQKA